VRTIGPVDTRGRRRVLCGARRSNGVSLTYQGADSWSFDFYAPKYDPVTNTLNGQELNPGLYDMATRYPFNSPTKPGIDISGAGRGNNQESGWFRVLDFARAANGDLLRFAVDFKQFDESLTESGPGLYGSLRFNSNRPITVPEPATFVLILLGLSVVGFVAWIRQNSG
jgi:PEP-CTERM motif-containing protein